jgi:hypothetical protein
MPFWAVNSAGECHPHTVEVVGSNPTPPTTKINKLGDSIESPFSFSPQGLDVQARYLAAPHTAFLQFKIASMLS